MVELGSAQGSEPLLFSRIWDAVLLPDGHIVVSDDHEPHVRVFGSDGSHVASFGASGEGPAEFGAPPILAFRPPDTLLAWDSRYYRLSRYRLDGTLLDQRSLNERIRGEHALPHIFGGPIWQVRSDGTLPWTGSLSSLRAVDGLHQMTTEPIVFGPDGDPVVRFGSLPLSQGLGFEYGDGGLSRVVNPFLHSATLVASEDPYLVVSAPGESPDLYYIDASGDTARILRAPVVTRSMVAEAREELLESVGTWGADVPPRLGTVRAPEQVQRVLAIGPDAVLTEVLDDHDVPQLRLHRIERLPRSR